MKAAFTASPATVFVVDDDDAVRDSLEALLQSCGLVTRTFGDAASFFQSVGVAAHGCLVLDMRLPDASGLEVMEQVQRASLPLRVVIITAYADIPLAVAAMKAGAHDFLEKPYSDTALLASVRTALDIEGRALEADVLAAHTAARLSTLTEREREVMMRLVAGKQNKQIAGDLGISPRTVEIHRSRLMQKMDASSLSHLVRMVISADSASVRTGR